MSLYEDYVKDFPCRILKLYKKNLQEAMNDKMEVTFLVSLAASAIAVPLERLRARNCRRNYNPFGEREMEFKEAADLFDKLWQENFRNCELWDNVFDEWLYGTRSSTKGDPNSWEELKSAKPIDASYTAKQGILHLRDSLAHGLICTLGENVIEKILLLVGTEEDGFEFLIVTPQSLEKFLCNWIDWLKKLPKSPFKSDK